MPCVATVLKVGVDTLAMCTLGPLDSMGQVGPRCLDSLLVTCSEGSVFCLEQRTYLCGHLWLLIEACGDDFGGSDITNALADVTYDRCGVFLQVDGVSIVCCLSEHMAVCVFKAILECRNCSRWPRCHLLYSGCGALDERSVSRY